MDRNTTKSLAPAALSDDELTTVSGGALVNVNVAPTLNVINQINTGIQVVIGKGVAFQILGNAVV